MSLYFSNDVFINITISVYENKFTVGAYRSYQILSAISVIILVSVSIVFAIKKRYLSPHYTSQIILTFYQLTKIIQSLIAFSLATLLLNFNISPLSLIILILNAFMMIVVILLRILQFLVVFDVLFKTSKIRDYGNCLASILLTIALIISSILLSFGIAFIIFCFCVKFEDFIVYFSFIIAVVQLCSAMLSTFLYKMIKEMRRKSISSSSLAERHMCFKNLEMVTSFLQETVIKLLFGCISLLATIFDIYILKLDLLTGFTLCFIWFELGSIISVIYGAYQWQRNYSKSHTVAPKISNNKETDIYFKNLHESWNT